MKCGCRKKQRKCGLGCLCQSCMNTDGCDRYDTENEQSDFEAGCDEAFEQIEEEIITEDDFYDTTYEY